jgi:multisubunit Na+/H+ antiporter MnhC subunit
LQQVAKRITDETKAGLQRLGRKLKKPVPAAAIAGAEVLGTAIAVGVAETALGLVAAYAAYRSFKKNARQRTARRHLTTTNDTEESS